jgi:ATP-dependent Clp protease ATP-binding subunit ClpA
VGKTYFAKVLSEELFGDKQRLKFFDMSQFGEPHAAASLFGQARGYVGSTSYGSLTATLRDEPQSLILLDEFEKAHPEVHRRFLTAWNDGFITEVSDGAKVSTSDAIFILTTNAATRRIGEIARDTSLEQDDQDRLVKQALLDAAFAPELLSRIDTVFAFSPIEGLDIARVVALEIEKLTKQFGLGVADKGIEPAILLDAIKYLQGRTNGGVRDIVRAIEQEITDGLIDARAKGARSIRLAAAGEKVRVEIAELKPTQVQAG